ncbi:MAG: flagellar hook-associated protein FlgL [Thalassotalea sp.]
MRVSTAQFYFQNGLQLTNKQSDVNEQIQYISSGKRVLTAKDDAVAYGTLTGYKDELNNIEKYKRNIIQAESRNSLQDVVLSNAEGFMNQLKQYFIQSNNGTLAESDRQSIAKLAEGGLDQILNVANTKDETGSYIFAGYQTDTQPFQLQSDNSVVYNGDNGTRKLQIANNISVDLNQSGTDVFQNVPNRQGDFSANYTTNTSGILLESAVIVSPGTHDQVSSPPDYTFTFSTATDLTVTDSGGATVFSTNSYSAGQAVSFNGIEVKLSGNPLPGDQFDLTPQENISVFDTLKGVIDWMNAPSTSGVEHEIDHHVLLNQLDKVMEHLTSRRADAGVRLQLLDNQSNNHADREVTLAKSSSGIEDLDYAKAISHFEQSKVALQAAQQSFIQIKNLSLFNYL